MAYQRKLNKRSKVKFKTKKAWGKLHTMAGFRKEI